MSTPQNAIEMEKRVAIQKIIVFGIGSILLIFLIIFVVTWGTTYKRLECESNSVIDNYTNVDTEVVIEWQFDNITKAKTEITYNTTDHITDNQINEFKNSIEEAGIYKNIDYGDYWSYKVTAKADFDLDKADEALGGTTLDDATNHFSVDLDMTCSVKHNP